MRVGGRGSSRRLKRSVITGGSNSGTGRYGSMSICSSTPERIPQYSRVSTSTKFQPRCITKCRQSPREQWSNGAVKEGVVLEHLLRPAQLLGEAIVLQFWPGAWPSVIQSDPNSKLGSREWPGAERLDRAAADRPEVRRRRPDSCRWHHPPFSRGKSIRGLAGAFQKQFDASSNRATSELTAV